MLFIKLSALFLMVFTFAFGAEQKTEDEEAAVTSMLSDDQREFNEKSSKLSTLNNRINEADRQFRELIRLKALAKTPAEKQEIIRQMVELNEQRNRDVDAYTKLKAELTLRYPHQGENLRRRYHHQSKRSLEEIEGVAGLDELLTRTKRVIDRKFAPFKPPEGETAVGAGPGEETVKPKKRPRIRLEK